MSLHFSAHRQRRDSRDNRDSGRPQRDGGHDANPGNNLHIAGLAMRTRESDLEEIFGKFGKVSKFHPVLELLPQAWTGLMSGTPRADRESSNHEGSSYSRIQRLRLCDF